LLLSGEMGPKMASSSGLPPLYVQLKNPGETAGVLVILETLIYLKSSSGRAVSLWRHEDNNCHSDAVGACAGRSRKTC
jgi:hypothetical protein